MNFLGGPVFKKISLYKTLFVFFVLLSVFNLMSL